jgi:hypothetical protein
VSVLTSSPSARLKLRMSPAVPAMNQRFAILWTRENLAEIYLEWLRVLHATIRATEPLMLDAFDLCLRTPADGISQPLGRYLSKHLKEEFGHDFWLRDDYAICGGDVTDLDDNLPSAAVTHLVGAQYYLIRHVHPLALLGYIAVLEGHPPSPQLATYLAARTGFPERGFTGLAKHSILDVKHRDEFYQAIDGFGLTSQQERIVSYSALLTVKAVCDLVDEVLLRVSPKEPERGG